MKSLLIILAIVVVGLLVTISFFTLGTEQITGDSIKWFITLAIASGGAWLAMLWVANRTRYSLESSNNLWITLLILAFAARLVVAVGSGEQAWLSDDVYRYVWEGKLVSNAMNPFAVSPKELEGSGLADEAIYPKINHPWLPTIYPPLSQYLFALAYQLGGDSLFGFKLLAFLFELLTALMILRFVREMHLPRWTALVYLFCPLVFIEFIISSHVDILALPFLLLFLLNSSLTKPQSVQAGVWLAAAAMIKLPALFFGLPLLFGYDWKDRGRFVGTIAVVSALLYLPFIVTAGTGLFGSLWTYLGTWQFNGSVFNLLASFMPAGVARTICAVAFALVALVVSWGRRRRDRLPTMFMVYGAYVVFTAALFPWYLVWLLPFLIINRNAAFLVLTVTVFLSYHVLIGYYTVGAWSVGPYFAWIEYLPFYGILGWMAYRRLTTRAAKLT